MVRASTALLNQTLLEFGLEAGKPLISAALLPPVPLLLMVLLGAWQMRRHRMLGWLLIGSGVAGVWLSSTEALADCLQQRLLGPLHALAAQDIRHLADAKHAGSAIIVLGGGRQEHAAEYGAPNLGPLSLERLRYALWLARRTGLPVGYSGGVGHAQPNGVSEAQAAAHIAADEFGQPLKWTEDRSRDTRENAARSIAMLHSDGISRVVLVTHGWHMRRSLRAFERAAQRVQPPIEVIPAPMGLATHQQRAVLRWLPSGDGFLHTRQALHEYLGLLAGA